MAREEARIKAKRDANEQRRLRYLNAKARMMGLDVATLDQQVAEKQRMKQNEREADRFERTQAMEIERILAQSMEEERKMKEYQMNQMRNDWDRAIQLKKTQAAEPKGPDFDNAQCGPSAALRFSGEDTNRFDRLKQQKDQMRRWIQEQVAEKAQLKHLQQEDEMSYAEMLKAIDEIRANTEREEKELRQFIQYSNKDYNREVSCCPIVATNIFLI
jgi:DNA polymerase III alpha subunit (gram-positive type)